MGILDVEISPLSVGRIVHLQSRLLTVLFCVPNCCCCFCAKNAGMSEESYQSFLERSLQVTHPLSASLGRVGNPEEVVELIAFLVSDRAKFITGECIAIDGARQNLGAR